MRSAAAEQTFQHLRLHATDADDLKVIATVTQDALVSIGNFDFLPDERRFILVLYRFCWECKAEPATASFQRVASALVFDGVTNIKLRGIDLKQRDLILDLLTIDYIDQAVILHFAGNRDIRIEVATLDCRLDDHDEPWPALARPTHGADS